jgi:hypothetical protein
MLLRDAGAADEVIAAGVLHEALEQTDATAYDIYARFGRRVGDIVCAVSCDPGIPGYARREAALRDQAASAGDDALTRHLRCSTIPRSDGAQHRAAGALDLSQSGRCPAAASVPSRYDGGPHHRSLQRDEYPSARGGRFCLETSGTDRPSG